MKKVTVVFIHDNKTTIMRQIEIPGKENVRDEIYTALPYCADIMYVFDGWPNRIDE